MSQSTVDVNFIQKSHYAIMIVCNLKPKDSTFSFVSDNLRQLGGVEGGMSAIKIIFILV